MALLPGGVRASCGLFSPQVLREALDGAARRGDLRSQIDFLRGLLAERIPYVTDAYSQLRYARVVLESFAPPALSPPGRGAGRAPAAAPAHAPAAALHPLERSLLRELECLARLRAGEPAAELLAACQDALDLGAVLRSFMRGQVTPPLPALLGAVGRSEPTDALVRDLVVLRARQWEREELARLVGAAVRGAGAEERRAAYFTDLLAETLTPGLAEGQLAERIRRNRQRPRLLGPGLRLLVAGGYRGLVPLLHGLLESRRELPEASVWQVVEALSAAGTRESAEVLERTLLGPEAGRGVGASPPLQEMARLCAAHLREAERAEAETQSKGRPGEGPGAGAVLVQTVLNANLQARGPAAVGGVLTFLHTLGDALGEVPGWGRVVTVEVVPWGAYHPSARLRTPGKGCHEIIRIPVPALSRGEPRELMSQELAVRRTIRNTLRLRGIHPDIVHVRYTDNLSKGMLHLADTVSARLVFTLTPDPHRDFCDARGRLQRMGDGEALSLLNKVYIADRLVERANGILGIAHGSANTQLLSYFPRLCLTPSLQAKPVRVIPEGIRLDPQEVRGDAEGVLRMLVDHPGPHRLSEPSLRLPVILNVGRLAPAKGQHRLAAAWAQSTLRTRCALILIGGNLEAPGAEEREMVAAIAAVMERHPDLRGRFCHLGALDNPQVRLLERVLAARKGSGPPVYLCSSLKEEFGISILEAMSAGFLVLGPRRGGVGTYVEHGESGFLVDTSSAGSMRDAMEGILGGEEYSQERLAAIARAGREFVTRNFSIESIAGRFSAFYRSLAADPSASPTLELFHGPRRLFESAGRWLHPLFELEAFLAASPWPRPELRAELRVRDKIVGKAAALLLVRLGIRRVHAGLLSEPGQGVLERSGVAVSAEERIARIACQTETLLADVEDPEEAYRLIRRRVEGDAGSYLRR